MYNFITNNDFIDSAKKYKSFEGYRCGLTSFDKIMRIDKQTLTTLVSTPCSGKSTFTNFYGYQMGVTHNWRTLYLATETNRNDQAKKLSTLYASYQQASEHSIILEGALSNWEELLEAIKVAKQQFNIDMVVIDNFTMLQHLIGGEVNTTTIGRAISELKQASIDNDIAVILVAHTTKLTEGQKVTAYSVNGSANFFNISDYMFSLEISDYEAKETTINILKLRDDAKGQMNGKCVLKYDKITRKYSDTDSSTEDSSTEDNTPKDINKEIATDVMKAIMEEEAKQEDRQPAQAAPAAEQPAGTTKAATDTAANTPSRDNTTKQPRTQQQGQQQAAKEKAITEEVTKQEDSQPATQPAVTEEVKQEKQHITPDFIHNTKVSIMEQHKVLEISSLYNAIKTGRKHKEEIEAVRKIDRQANESEYRQAKDNILSFTPSCLCPIGGSAKAENVEHVNNLIAIDLDAKDNEGVTLEEMRTKINSLPYVMYSSISVGGKGMYALLPIAEENKNDFKAVFNALNEDFKALGLTLDGSCVNVNRERYMSYDDDEYWNTKCEIYTKKINTPTQVNTHPSKVGENVNKPLTAREYNKVKSMVEDIKENRLQLSKNHSDTLLLCNAIANIWGEEGRELIHIIRQQRSGYDEYKTDNNYTHVLDHLDEGEKFGLGLIFDKYNQAKGQTQAH